MPPSLRQISITIFDWILFNTSLPILPSDPLLPTIPTTVRRVACGKEGGGDPLEGCFDVWARKLKFVRVVENHDCKFSRTWAIRRSRFTQRSIIDFTLLFRELSYDLCQRPREIDALEAQPREPWCLHLHTLSPSPSANNRIDSCATRWRKRIGGAIKSPLLFPPEIANEQMSRYAKHRTITCSLIDLSSLPSFSTPIISCFTHSFFFFLSLLLPSPFKRWDKNKKKRKIELDVKWGIGAFDRIGKNERWTKRVLLGT